MPALLSAGPPFAGHGRTVRPSGSRVKGVAQQEPAGHGVAVCRSIKTLRPPYTDDVGDDDVHAAALQYVRKVAGMRTPSSGNAEAFDDAVQQVAAATQELLDRLVVRPRSRVARPG